jgi:hypothetical protein
VNTLEAEVVLLRGQLDKANAAIDKLQQPAKPARAPRKAKSSNPEEPPALQTEP